MHSHFTCKSINNVDYLRVLSKKIFLKVKTLAEPPRPPPPPLGSASLSDFFLEKVVKNKTPKKVQLGSDPPPRSGKRLNFIDIFYFDGTP